MEVKCLMGSGRCSIWSCGLMCVMCELINAADQFPRGHWVVQWGRRTPCPLWWRRINAGASGLCFLLWHEERFTQRQEEEALRSGTRHHRWGAARQEVRPWRDDESGGVAAFIICFSKGRNGLCFNVAPVNGMACGFNQDSSQLILLKEHVKSAGRRRKVKLNATCLCIFTAELPVLWDRPSLVCGSQPLPCAALISVLWL